MRVFQSTQIEVTIPASPKAKRLPQGSPVPVPLRQVRRELNVDHDDVARLGCLTEDEISALETHQVPDLHRLAQYARALGGELRLCIAFGAKVYRLNMDADAAPASEQDATRGWGDLDDPFPQSPEPSTERQERSRK
jgi:hypothetical protein